MTDRKGTFKVEFLKEIERSAQAKWEELKIFDENAPEDGSDAEKFFVTFPYPYMNGRLHLGHTFTISKCEFAVGFQRLKGKKCLFPFGFHVSGMPIKACADKIAREMALYGNPPQFPEEEEEAKTEEVSHDFVMKDKSKGKKSKAAAKQGAGKFQWQIMKSLGMSDEEICKFGSTDHWLEHFPPLCMADCKRMGLHVDWRRSFITTDVSPFYDSFVRWQFLRLKQRNAIKFGKRYTIFSPRDGQPCMDHDRASGEGVGPQEYTLIKLRVVSELQGALAALAGQAVFLVAATLRPETMYGQTNCWVGPDLRYQAVRLANGEVWVCTGRAARNLAYQGFMQEEGRVDVVLELSGRDILGLGLAAPLAVHPTIYTLPMLTVKQDKGTGVVTSVPSDSPDDWAALRDLTNKPQLREKFGISDDMVLPFTPVPIIDIPGFGDLAAVTVVDQLKIASQNDSEKLAQAKEMVYMKGFYEGVMAVGPHKGSSVQEAKPEIRAELLTAGQAVVYQEPEKAVVSRSGEECVVSLCDQWYLDYGEEEWKAGARRAVEQLNTFSEEVKKNFHSTLEWLKEHACSRTYGLGSKLPWDESWLIESLSDSTIYMAYYTVAHLLQGGSLTGSGTNAINVTAAQMTPEVWDFVLLGGPVPATEISRDTLDRMRREFEFWYPLDLRVSGKDLVPNHLTYCVYNHVAMWPEKPEKWVRGIRANGHLLLNSEKMSKSTGNFMTLSDAIDAFSADGMRLALADSGDTVEDANFVFGTADAGILKLFTLIEWTKEVIEDKSMREEKDSFHDQVFENEINLKIQQTEANYEKLLFKEALRTGLYEMLLVRDKYRELCGERGLCRGLALRWLEVEALLLSPVCPHVAEHLWALLGKTGSVLAATWPTAPAPDTTVIAQSEYLMDTARDFRLKLKNATTVKSKGKGKGETVPACPPTHATVYVARSCPAWQVTVLSTLAEMFAGNAETVVDNKAVSVRLGKLPELKKYMKKVMPFVAYTKDQVAIRGLEALDTQLPWDEVQVLTDNLSYLLATLDLEGVDVALSTELGEKGDDCRPGAPIITFRTEPSLAMQLTNNQPFSGLFSLACPVLQGDNAASIGRRLARRERNVKEGTAVRLYRWTDPVLGPRTCPDLKTPLAGLDRITDQQTFTIDLQQQSIKLDGELLQGGLIFRVGSEE